jgi:hypothetical protein
MTLRLLCPALLLIGLALMLPFETPLTLVLGVGALMGFVVSGVFLVAAPDFLDADED